MLDDRYDADRHGTAAVSLDVITLPYPTLPMFV